MRDGQVLTIAQLGVVWQRAGLGTPPLLWTHETERHAGNDPVGAIAEAERQLVAAGVLDEAGIPDAELVDVLRRIEVAPLLLDTRFSSLDAGQTRALVLGTGRSTSLRYVLAAGTLSIEPVEAGCVPSLLGCWPDVGPTPGPTVELDTKVWDRAAARVRERGDGSDEAFCAALSTCGAPDAEARALTGLVGGVRTLYGQVGVTLRADGREHRGAEIVQVVDTEAGRAAMWARGGVLRVAPGTYERFESLLTDLIDRARRSSRR